MRVFQSNLSEPNAFKALGVIYESSPIALAQIIAISAVEVFCLIEPQFERPGDFGWDPLKIVPLTRTIGRPPIEGT